MSSSASIRCCGHWILGACVLTIIRPRWRAMESARHNHRSSTYMLFVGRMQQHRIHGAIGCVQFIAWSPGIAKRVADDVRHWHDFIWLILKPGLLDGMPVCTTEPNEVVLRNPKLERTQRAREQQHIRAVVAIELLRLQKRYGSVNTTSAPAKQQKNYTMFALIATTLRDWCPAHSFWVIWCNRVCCIEDRKAEFFLLYYWIITRNMGFLEYSTLL